ncbi:MAG TPA: hypothetical protein VG675_18335 [Bryobacteraceae bacterium]|nr:hypothetical protein [Bryobacteraceae bacterium]
MNWMDTVGGLLKQYAAPNASPANAEAHFDEVTRAVPSPALGGALADAFRSSSTPPFAQLAAQMFSNANNTQKASVLNELFASAGAALPSILGSAGLGVLASKLTGGQSVAPEAAAQIPAEAVQQIAQHIEQKDPSIVDRLGALYSQHPTLVKTLGSAVLAVTMAKLANRTEGRN